jgi:Tol biopolymer transport system component/DNA-binding winged helix-turn-helix (wHTH) protein
MMSPINPQRVRFGPFEVDLETHELWKNGIRLKLGGQPFEILAMLLKRSGQMVSREELQREIWAADTFVDFNHGLNAAVNKLRETLTDSAEEPKYIETLPRRGYRFIGKIEPALSPPVSNSRPMASTQVAPPAPIRAPVEDQMVVRSALRPEASKRPRRMGPLMWVLLTAALTLGFLVIHRWWETRGAELVERMEKRAEAGPGSGMVTLVPDPASDPAISPDGKSVAFRRNSDTPGAAGIFVTSGDGKRLTQLTHHPGDCCPAWSPDGTAIAYSRIATDEYGIYVVKANGGEPRKISHEDPRKKRGELAWTADGKYIAFSGDSPKGGSQIFLLAVGDASVRPLSEPQGQDRDWGPAFSPDGTKMAFVRANGAGFPEEIFAMPANGGPAEKITSERAAIMGPPAWSSDGQYIIFSSTREGEPSLWKISADGGAAKQIEAPGVATWHPTISRQDHKMVVQKILRSSAIIGMYLKSDGARTTILTASSGRNEGPRLSPDGKRLVFMSDRAGTLEIWVSNRDGSEAVKLTNLNGCGTPRWSPDGKWIAFDTVGNGAQGVYVISAGGGTPRALVTDHAENSVPSWSNDGKWIYFGSNRSGQDQVWKIASEGGQPIQVTRRGGFAAWESPDGRTLYYANSRFENPEIWQMPATGGIETIFPGAVRPKSWAAWSVTEHGIFFCPQEGPNVPPAVAFYDFATRLTRQVSLIDKSPFWLSATANGQEIFYDQAGRDESSILLVEANR